MNGYILIPPDLVSDDANLHRLTAEARQRRDAWDAACVESITASKASGDEEFYASDEWPTADDEPDDDGPEWTREAWFRTDQPDGPDRTNPVVRIGTSETHHLIDHEKYGAKKLRDVTARM